MLREFTIGDEPVPGYRLKALLGEGGFGKVWRAEGPGRVEVALKVIDIAGRKWKSEFDSVRMAKGIRHPNLVSISGIWVIDANGVPLDEESIDRLSAKVGDAASRRAGGGTLTLQVNALSAERLVIAMGLGDKDLLAVLRDYRVQGKPGIPVDKLLDYMEAASNALDYLNEPRHDKGDGEPRAVYHCDIKPNNIMLVGTAAQVCDLGLLRNEGVKKTAGALTYAYCAPELYWENRATRGTDQYSLAITYYELRMAELPFSPDLSLHELVIAHRDGTLDFSLVPEAEQAVLKKATSPKPEDRYETCIDMVRALRRAAGPDPRLSDVNLLETDLLRRPPSHLITPPNPLTRGREFVPGYRLGEHRFYADSRTVVWSANGPTGGLYSLWIYDLAGVPGAIDLDALRCLQKVDDPHLARVFGWWCLNKSGENITSKFESQSATDADVHQLVIASEFARNNLVKTAQETNEAIPADTCLAYARRASLAIDHLNAPMHGPQGASLIHTDVRPMNLLLVGNEVKLGNFAWCRALQGDAAAMTGLECRPRRLTLAPELAGGNVDRNSDQYALAVSYAQMRSGTVFRESALPSATTEFIPTIDVGLGDLQGEELAVIDRAMHDDPRQRFANCQAMIEALEKALKKNRPVPPPPPPPEPEPEPSPETVEERRRTLVAVKEDLEGPAPDPRQTRDIRGQTTDPEPWLQPAPRRSKKVLAISIGALLLASGAVVAVPGLRDRVLGRVASETADTTSTSPGTEDETAPVEPLDPAAKKTPEQSVVGFLELAEQKIQDKEPSAKDDLKGADAIINAELPDRADLRQRSALAHAWLEWQERNWTGAEEWLRQADGTQTRGDDLATRFHLLRVLIPFRYNGGELVEGTDLEALSLAIEELKKTPNWPKGDRLLTAKTKELIGEVVAQVADLLADHDSRQRARAELVLGRLPKEGWPPKIGLLLDVNSTVRLLEDHTATRQTVENSVQKWLKNSAQIPGAPLARLANALVGWGLTSKDPESLGKSIEWVHKLPRNKESRRGLIDLSVEELRRAASEELRRATSRSEVKWNELVIRCRDVDDLTITQEIDRQPFVQACLAECLLEDAIASGSRLPPEVGERIEAAKSSVNDQLYSDDDRRYVDYVLLRWLDRSGHLAEESSLTALADSVSASFEDSENSPLLFRSPIRRSGAADALMDAASELTNEIPSTSRFDPPALEKDRADKVYRWLSSARNLKQGKLEMAAVSTLAAAAVATGNSVDPLIEELCLDKECREPWILLRGAKAVEQTKPAEAIDRYARVLRFVDIPALSEDDATRAYRDVIEKATALEEKATSLESDASEAAKLKQACAEFYAGKGWLLRYNVSLVPPAKRPEQLVFEAFDAAVRLDPQKIDYYVERGFARWQLAAGNPKLDDLRKDTTKILDFPENERPPAAFGLLGNEKFLEARALIDVGSPEASIAEKLDSAVSNFQKAIKDAKNEHYADFLDGVSAAYVDLANSYTDVDEKKTVAQRRRYLDLAISCAKKSQDIELRTYPEYAFLNEGNAEEDLNWVLKDYSENHYCAAIKAFKKAGGIAYLAGRSPADAYYHEGRCRFKLAKAISDRKFRAEDTCGETQSQQVEHALQVLQDSIDAGEKNPLHLLSPATKAEVHHWRGQLYLLRPSKLSADESLKRADQEFAAAAKTANASTVQWSVYQEEATEAALARKDFEQARKRAQALMHSPSSAVPLERRSKAVNLLVRASADRQQGLQAFADGLRLPEFAGKNEILAELLTWRSGFISADLDFWGREANKRLCRESAEKAKELAEQAHDKQREVDACLALAKHAENLLSSAPSNSEHAQLYSTYLSNLIDLQPDLKVSADWRIKLAKNNKQLAFHSAVKPVDQRRFAKEGFERMTGVPALFKGNQRSDLEKLRNELSARSN